MHSIIPAITLFANAAAIYEYNYDDDLSIEPKKRITFLLIILMIL